MKLRAVLLTEYTHCLCVCMQLDIVYVNKLVQYKRNGRTEYMEEPNQPLRLVRSKHGMFINAILTDDGQCDDMDGLCEGNMIDIVTTCEVRQSSINTSRPVTNTMVNHIVYHIYVNKHACMRN